MLSVHSSYPDSRTGACAAWHSGPLWADFGPEVGCRHGFRPARGRFRAGDEEERQRDGPSRDGRHSSWEQGHRPVRPTRPDGRLLEPLGEVVLGVEEVDDEADPAGQEDDDRRDDLADEADGLLEDVDDGEDGENEADDVDNGCHNTVV